MRNHPHLTIQVKPRTLGDKLEGATQTGTEAEQTMPQSTRTDQTREDSIPQEGAVTPDSPYLGETGRPEDGPYNPGLNKTTGVQGLNYTIENWYTKEGATILPLGLESRRVYQGEGALPEHMLQVLQIQPVHTEGKKPDQAIHRNRGPGEPV